MTRRQENHVGFQPALASLPVNDCGLSGLAPVKENMDRHDESKVSHADIHAAIDRDVVRRFINKCWKSHPRFSSINTPEQLRIGPYPSLQRNELTDVIDERIAGARQAAEPVSGFASATTPDFANDNEPLREAA